jgi:molybdenum cofactor guanylyltransferase
MEVVPRDRFGGIVLCGGKSSRMGRAKLSLPFGGETLLGRVVRIVREVVSPVVVVAGPEHDLPELPAGTLVARDEIPNQGPLGGLAAGMAALRGRADAVYLSACDVPLLRPEFVRALIESLGTHEAAVGWDGQFYPLSGVYRLSLEARVKQLIAAGRLAAQFLARECEARLVNIQELRAVDPELVSLHNVNCPEDYREALRTAGLASSDDSAAV